MNNTSASQDRIIQEAVASRDGYRENITELLGIIDEMDDEITSLNKSIATLEEERNRFESELLDMTAERDDALSEVDTLKNA